MKTIGTIFLICLFILLNLSTAQNLLPPERTGKFYVSNFNGDNIVVYDSAGNYLNEFTAPGLDGPRGIVFSSKNIIYIASQNSDEIFVFNHDEALINKYGHEQLDGPT